MRWIATYHSKVEDISIIAHIHTKERCEILWTYLVELPGGSSYSDVTKKVFDTRRPEVVQQVATVIHSYNFSGQNSGRFADFEDKKRLHEGIREFVHKYHKGEACADREDIIFEEWLQEADLEIYEDWNDLSDFSPRKIKISPTYVINAKEMLEKNKRLSNEFFAKSLNSHYENYVECSNGEYCIIGKIQVNDIVVFGKNNQDNGSLFWYVLDIIDDKVLLLNMNCVKISEMDYRDIWVESAVKKYLDEEFLNNCFTDDEKNNIVPIENICDFHVDTKVLKQKEGFFNKLVKNTEIAFEESIDKIKSIDKVFILSYDELKKYCGKEYNNIPTDFDSFELKKSMGFDYRINSYYWTRPTEVKCLSEHGDDLVMFDTNQYKVNFNGGVLNNFEDIPYGDEKIIDLHMIPEQIIQNIPYGSIDPYIDIKKTTDVIDEIIDRTKIVYAIRPAMWVKLNALKPMSEIKKSKTNTNDTEIVFDLEEDTKDKEEDMVFWTEEELNGD